MMMKNKICNILDNNYFWAYFALFGAFIQTLVFLLTQDSYLSFVSGLAGVFSVVLCSEKSISGFYFWSFVQIITFTIICCQENLYAKLIENAFYAVTLIGGLFIWNNNKKDEKVVPREMSSKSLIILGVINLILVFGGYFLLKTTNDSMPFMDGLTTITAIIAQILMIMRYREQWVFWLAVDLASIILWASIGNYYMVIQYVFWTLNCFYGYYKWGR